MIVVLNLFDIIDDRHAEYAQYLRRVQAILDRHGARVLVYGSTRMIYKGHCTQQYCGLIAYPDIEALKAFSRDPDFQEIIPLRDNSTENYVMTAVEDFETMDLAAEYLESLQPKK